MMKKIFLIIVTGLIFSCSGEVNTEGLIGAWSYDVTSPTDTYTRYNVLELESDGVGRYGLVNIMNNEILNPEDLYTVYEWSLLNDTLKINYEDLFGERQEMFKIESLNDKELVVKPTFPYIDQSIFTITYSKNQF